MRRYVNVKPNWFCAVILLALVVNLSWMVAFPNKPHSDAAYYSKLGQSLAQQGTYEIADVTDPTIWPGGALSFRPLTDKAYVPPGYPLFLAAVYKVFGYNNLAPKLANVAMYLAAIGLLYRIALHLMPKRWSLAATTIVAFFPGLIAFTSLVMTEMLTTFLLMLALLLVLQFDRARVAASRAAILGVIIGYATLVRPVMIVLLPALLVYELWAFRRFKVVILRWSVVGFVAVLIILSWSARNLMVLGEFVPISTNGGVLFYVGNRDGASGTEDEPAFPFHLYPDEVERNRAGYRMGIAFIRQHPLEFLALLPKKVYHLYACDCGAVWFSFSPEAQLPPRASAMKWLSQTWYLVVVLLAACGVFFKEWRGFLKQHGPLFFLIAGFWTAFHMPFGGEGRFHVPLIPLLALFAGSSLCLLYTWVLHMFHRSP